MLELPQGDEDVLALSGGGDWHMAYLLLYRARTIPYAPPAAAPAAAAAAASAPPAAGEAAANGAAEPMDAGPSAAPTSGS